MIFPVFKSTWSSGEYRLTSTDPQLQYRLLRATAGYWRMFNWGTWPIWGDQGWLLRRNESYTGTHENGEIRRKNEIFSAESWVLQKRRDDSWDLNFAVLSCLIKFPSQTLYTFFQVFLIALVRIHPYHIFILIVCSAAFGCHKQSLDFSLNVNGFH